MTLRPEALPPRRAYFEVPPTRHEMTDDQKTAWREDAAATGGEAAWSV
jgi:hypothetical protein